MEVYEGAIETVSHTVYLGDEIVPADGVVNAIVYDPDGPNPERTLQAEGEEGRYTVPLGQEVTGNHRPKTIEWRYTVSGEDVVTPEESIRVVRPYISINEYNRGVSANDALLPSDFRRLESVARKVIDAYTRQNFQLRKGVKYVVPGGGGSALQLPDRLVNLNEIYVADGSVTTHVSDYSLADYITMDVENPWLLRRRGGVPMNPVTRPVFFKREQHYVVEGDWGWPHVPEPVKEAARLLVRDYSDDDALYREKYITVIRAADWRMEFGATGMATTGNANADMMLERYRNYRLEVI